MKEQESNELAIKVRILNGYRVIYMPDHPSSMKCENWLGWVYEHIYFAEQSLGRQLHKDEVVHHLNGIREDNRCSNLLILTKSQHARLHSWLEAGAPFEKSNGENGMNSGKSKGVPVCKVCGLTLQTDQSIYCSTKCNALDKRIVERPSKGTLAEELKTTSMLALGRKYNVSDNAVRKWAKSYGLL